MRFSELSEIERVRIMRESFDFAIEEIALTPEKLNNYINLEPPKHVKPNLIKPADSWPEEEKRSAEKINSDHILSVNALNAKLDAEHAIKVSQYNKIKELISTIPKSEYCICSKCIDTDSIKGFIPTDYDIILQQVRSDVEKKYF